MNAWLWLCAVALLLSGSVRAGDAACDAASGECGGDEARRVSVMRNGGNNTGAEPVLRDEWLRHNVIDAAQVADWARRLGLAVRSPAAVLDELRVFTVRGQALKRHDADHALLATGVRAHEPLFLVPRAEHWIWPGLFVGHRAAVGDTGLTIETLALSPRLFALDGFLAPAEADRLRALAAPDVTRANVVEATGQAPSDVRTSGVAWLFRGRDPAIDALQARAEAVTGVHDTALFEQVQVVHYQGDQRYEAHYDYFPPERYPGESGARYRLGEQRLATLFFYLNDVDEGGETIFPFADVENSQRHLVGGHVDYRDCERGLKVQPRRGRAILWYNTLADGHMDGALDNMSLHGACPVRGGGEKWAANLWIYNKRADAEALEEELRRTRARLNGEPEEPPVAELPDDIVPDDAEQEDSFPPEEVTPGFRFSERVDDEGNAYVQVLRTESQALPRTAERINVRVYPNGGVSTGDDYYVRMSVARSASPYELLEVIDVAPVALAFAFPDDEGVPCDGETVPFGAYDALGRRVRNTLDLTQEHALFLRDAGELWIWPALAPGQVVSPPDAPHVEIETLSTGPRLFRLRGLVADSMLDRLRFAAAPLLSAAVQTGAGGGLGTLSASLPRDGLIVSGELDAQVAKVLQVSRDDVVSATVRAWKVLPSDKPFVVPAASAGGENGGVRLASLLIYGSDAPGADTVFPLASAASASDAMSDTSALKQLCAGGASDNGDALRVPIKRGESTLLYNLVTADKTMETFVDQRAVHVVCPPKDGEKWVFEKILFLHQPTRAAHGDFGPPKAPYALPSSSGEFLQVGAADGEQINVHVFRVGGNNTGAEAWRARVAKSKDAAPLSALIERAVELLELRRDAPGERAFRAFNEDGFVIKHTNRLANGAHVFVAPKSWHWMWPSLTPGHRRELRRVPRGDGHDADSEPLVLETLSVWPRAFVVRDFLSAAEREWLLQRSRQTIEKPMSTAAAPVSPYDPSTTWLFVTEIGDPIDVVNKRIAAMLRIAHSEDYYEALVVERYKKTQKRDEMEAFFDVETGFFSHMPMLQHGVNRLAGVYMQLQDPESGGDIVFPHALRDGTLRRTDVPDPERCKPGATSGVRPNLRAGDALVYYTLHSDAHQAPLPIVDRRSIQDHCAVGGGEKWGGFVFVHNRADPTRDDPDPVQPKDAAKSK